MPTLIVFFFFFFRYILRQPLLMLAEMPDAADAAYTTLMLFRELIFFIYLFEL